MDGFIGFTLSVAANADKALKPVYSVVPTLPLFFDRRLPAPAGESLFRLLESLGEKATSVALSPDAGIWECRGRQRIHTHSSAMCWAGMNRLAAIAARLDLSDRAAYWNMIADPLHVELLERAWYPKREAFTAAFGSDDLDASVLLLPDLGICEVNDPRFIKTVAAMEREKHVMRYADEDVFGLAVTAFLIFRFWLIDAWWSLGRRDEARDFLWMLWRTAIGMGCYRKMSIRNLERYSEISLRLIPWLGSFSPV